MINERIYFDESDKRVYLDVYAVADTRLSPRDSILIIPGGAYAGVCIDREGECVALSYLAQGINSFVLNYSVGEDAVYPRQLLDAARALKYIKDNAEKYNINPNRVFGIGFSAGGHLCGTLATKYKLAEQLLGEKEGYLKLRGAILSYPVVTCFGKTHIGSFSNLLKKPFDTYNEEEKRTHSIECNIDENTPDMFIWHTSEDESVPIDGSLKICQRFYDIGRFCEMHIYPYGKHGSALCREFSSGGDAEFDLPKAADWFSQTIGWMKTLS